MAISILHRAAGNALAVGGAAMLIFWLWSVAGGAESYAFFQTHASAWYGQVILIGLSWSFFQHMLSGLRHFVMDVGAGYEVDGNNRWSLFLPLLALMITGLFWMVIYWPG